MRRASGLVVLGLVAGLVVSPAAPPGLAAEQGEVRWQNCPAEFGPAFDCAVFAVPLDHDDPDGAAIGLKLVRLPASDPARKLGSIFFNPGGPGGSGVDFVAGAGPFLYSDEVRARFDLVGFDPRGIIRSEPLLCFESFADAVAALPPFAFPVDRAEERLVEQQDTELAGACELRGGSILDHMATADVARDLDLLRAGVGDRTLNYVGYSYGSFLGVTYANLFPGRVGALVVDGVLDPIAWTTGRGLQALTQPVSTRLRSDAGAQATLEEFFRLCDDAGAAGCAFAPDAADRYAALAARLRVAAVTFVNPLTGQPERVRYSDLIGTSLGAMYDSAGWPDFAEYLAALEAAADPSAAHVAVPTSTGYPNFVEGFPGVLCSDSVSPNDHRYWARAGAQADAQYGYFGRLWTWASSPCATWPGRDTDRYVGPFTRHTANPVLVVGTRFDPATRYEGAVTVADLLPNSTLLTVEGWGHTSLFLSLCADQAVSKYLLTGDPPAPGTTCAQDVPPFATADQLSDRQRARADALEQVGRVPGY